MMNKNKKLIVDNLTVSFRTPQGFVRAVRGVSFDLYEGETLAIVGESGSGKSVSSKAIMGILEGNAVIDAGHIYYENQDLTKISEENFHKIRGKKIGMIFQDPLSSLNPIMRIGKQITEAMLINGNHLKNRYKDMIHKYRMNLLNAKQELENVKTKFKADKKQLIEENNKDEIPNLQQQYISDVQNLKKKISDAKIELAEQKKHARKVIKEDWQNQKIKTKEEIVKVKEQYAQEINKIKENTEEIAANQEKIVAKKNELKEKIAELKKKLINQSNKELKAQVNKEIKQIIEQYTKEINDLDYKFAIRTKNKEKRAKIAELREKLRRYKKVTKKEARERAIKVMREVGIPEPERRLRQYPFQFSGGMRQRIVIAIALTLDPDILICDEPTTALDVTIQAQILELIKEIKSQRSLSIIFITHDLGVVANMADRVAVMYAGKIVEIGTVDEIFYNPKHPYTWALLSSMPDLDSKERLNSIPGTPPNMLFPPKGDAFADRNKYAMKIDFEKEPPFFKVSDTHYAATWLLHPDAPKVEMPELIKKRIERMKKLATEGAVSNE